MKLMYKKIVLVSIGISLLLSSCSDEFLEIVPKGKIIAEQTRDYEQLFYNIRLYSLTSTNSQVLLSPELIALEPFFSTEGLREQRLYRWEGTIYDDEQNSNELESTMEQLYIYNKIVNEVLNATEGTEAEKKSIQAEAKAGRALINFLLVNYYGLPYNEETSSTDLGFPIIDKADLTQSDFKRATVQENYDFIVKDLTEAIPNLANSVDSRFRVTKAAGKAILGKVYTFMGKFEEARPLLDQALSELNNVGIEVGLLDYNVRYDKPALNVDPESLFAKQYSNSYVSYRNSFVVKPEVMDLYDENDLRFDLYTNKTTANKPIIVEGAYRKAIGSGVTPFDVRVQDIYLLDAEVKCRLNDLSGSVSVLESFRKHRMPEEDAGVPAAVASNREALLRFIFDERMREFAVTGFYWFDARRLTVDPDIPTPVSSFTHAIYEEAASGNVVKTDFTLTKERLVLRFAPSVIAQNPNLINND